MASESRIRVGVSACLLGEAVRFDGGHKHDRFLTDVLGRFVEFVPYCPEVAAGLGTPRESIRLVRAGEEIRIVGVRSGDDHTRPLQRSARIRVRELRDLDLCGYVLKKDSPSCGMERVRLYPPQGAPDRKGRGVFAAALLDAFPDLPVEEEGRLRDPALRENWIERIFAYRRLKTLFAGRWTRGDLVRFHTRHKLQLLAHSPTAYRGLGRLVAGAKDRSPAELRRAYTRAFMAALARRATPRRNVNTMQHMLGFFRQHLDPASRAELLASIEDYGDGLVPLVVPLTLIRHMVRRFDVDYLADQVYLDPHPKELMLRNHV